MRETGNWGGISRRIYNCRERRIRIEPEITFGRKHGISWAFSSARKLLHFSRGYAASA
jgi:hypothetical protein